MEEQQLKEKAEESWGNDFYPSPLIILFHSSRTPGSEWNSAMQNTLIE